VGRCKCVHHGVCVSEGKFGDGGSIDYVVWGNPMSL